MMRILWLVITDFIFVIIKPLLIHVLKVLGVGFVAYIAADQSISYAEDYLFSYYNSFPTDVYALLTIAGFDKGVKMIFAAYVAKVATKTAFTTVPTWASPSASGGGTMEG